MNTKKLMALLCATAMASSTVVPVITANAEVAADAEVLWSDTFDGYENDPEQAVGGFTGPGLVVAKASRDTYKGINGVQLVTTGKEDDSSYFVVEPVAADAESDLAVTTTISRFASTSRGAYIKFDETYAPKDDKYLVLSTKVKITDNAHAYAPIFKVDDIAISNETLGVESGQWANLKIVYKDGNYELMVDNVALSGGSASSLSTITFNGLNADGSSWTADAVKSGTHVAGYHTVSFDDMVVYLTSDLEADAPEAETHGAIAVATPTPTPIPESAPKANVPENANVIWNESFDALDDVTYSFGAASIDATVSNLHITSGSRSSDSSVYTNAAVKENIAGDKIFAVTNGRFADAGRDIKLYLAENVKASDLSEGGYATLAFAAKLSPLGDKPAVIYFIDEATSTTYATITTDESSTSGIVVEADKWITVEFTMQADGSAYVYVDGEETPVGASVSTFPYLRMHDGSKENPWNTTVSYDNFSMYVVDDNYVATTPAPVPEVIPLYEDALIDFSQDMSDLDASYRNSLSTETGTYTDISGLTYTIGGRGSGTDGDTTNVRVEKDVHENQYLFVETSKYGLGGRAPLFSFTGAPTLDQLAADEDYVAVSFAAKLVPGSATYPATMSFPAVADFSSNGGYYIYNIGTITTAADAGDGKVSVDADTWFVVDIEVKKTGDYTVYVDALPVFTGTTVNSGADGSSDKVTLTGLPYVTTNAATKDITNSSFAIDSVIAYHSGDITPVETPEPPVINAAPSVSAPNNTTVIFAENFNSLEKSFTRMSATEAVTVDVTSDVSVWMGARDGESSSEAQYTAVSVKENVEKDNVLNLTGGKFGTITRAPKLSVNSPSVKEMGEDDYVAMDFAFRLDSVNAAGQASVLTLIANADDVVAADETNTETKNDGNVYGYVFGAFTTNEEDANDGKVEYVEADTWHTASIEIYNDSWYVALDGEYVFVGETATLAYSNGDKIAVTKLPQLVAGKNVKATVTYPSVSLDNMVVYTSQAPSLANVAITSATASAAAITADVATTAKVVVASYDNDGRLVSTTSKVVDLNAGENTVEISAAKGDSVMVWTAYNNSAMQAYCPSVTVE